MTWHEVIMSLQILPKIQQLPSPPLNEGAFLAPPFSFTGYFQFFDFMPYLPCSIKIRGRLPRDKQIISDQVKSSQLSGPGGRGLGEAKRGDNCSFSPPCSPTVSKASPFQSTDAIF